uniref:Uncharacterized protein n=1 Tax=Trichogramma kaykai TaxID=54128 RepID=A0ABD2VY76_9HYME
MRNAQRLRCAGNISSRGGLWLSDDLGQVILSAHYNSTHVAERYVYITPKQARKTFGLLQIAQRDQYNNNNNNNNNSSSSMSNTNATSTTYCVHYILDATPRVDNCKSSSEAGASVIYRTTLARIFGTLITVC